MQEYYIVCHLVRNGRMDINSKRSSSSGNFRRPVACAVVPMDSLVTVSQDDEPLRQLAGQLYTCDEKDFSQLHEMIFRRTVKSSERNSSITLAMRMFHGDLASVQTQHVNYLGKNTPLVRKVGFSEVMLPGEMRNDIFITISRGEFEKGGKSTAKNVEVSMQVLNSQGVALKVIHPAAGMEATTEYHSTVLYHNNSPRWAETVRLNIPFESVNEAYLIFGLKHCSRSDDSKYQTFATMKIIRQDGTTVSDTTHELCLFRSSATFNPTSSFAHLPSTLQEAMNSPVQAVHEHLSQREVVLVTTRVCSTKLTQDYNLLGLLRWRSQPPVHLMAILENIILVDGKDICVFLQDVFDALFGILDTDDEVCEQLVFNNIVHIVVLLSDRKYEHFKATLNTYIAKHFCGAMVYKKLICSLRSYIDNAHRVDLQRSLRKVVDVLTFLLRFIIQSRMLFARAKSNMGMVSFKEALLKVMHSINSMIITPEVAVSTKEAILSLYQEWLTELLAVFQGEELVDSIVVLLTTSLPSEVQRQPLTRSKLKLMGKIVNSSLFEDDAARTALLPHFLGNNGNNLVSYLQRGEELTLVWETISIVISRLERVGTPQDTSTVVQLLVPPLITGVAVMDPRQNPPVPFAHAAVCSFLGVLRMMTDESFVELQSTVPHSRPCPPPSEGALHHLPATDRDAVLRGVVERAAIAPSQSHLVNSDACDVLLHAIIHRTPAGQGRRADILRDRLSLCHPAHAATGNLFLGEEQQN